MFLQPTLRIGSRVTLSTYREFRGRGLEKNNCRKLVTPPSPARTGDAPQLSQKGEGGERGVEDGRRRVRSRTGELLAPKEHRRSGVTVNRYIAALSHALSFAVKERRLIERNPVSDIRRKP